MDRVPHGISSRKIVPSEGRLLTPPFFLASRFRRTRITTLSSPPCHAPARGANIGLLLGGGYAEKKWRKWATLSGRSGTVRQRQDDAARIHSHADRRGAA